jgi:TPR repeat protein
MRIWTVPVLLAVVLAGTACQTARRTAMARDLHAAGEYERAARIWRSLARWGDAEAQHRFGLLLGTGQGIPRDDERSLQYFRAAAEQGYEPSRQHLGHLYLGGKGSPETDPHALERMRETAEKGSADTKYRLGVLYFKGGPVVAQDEAEGILWMRAAAEQWSSTKPVVVARLVEDELLARAAEAGLAEAQHRLATMYSQGVGVPKSRAEAVKWHYLAANQGYIDSQFALASIYKNGTGVQPDPAEAARWYRRAAERGHAESQFQLALLYLRGRGVPLDPVEAHVWFNLAAAQGHGDAREDRDEIERTLTVDGLREAEELAVRLQTETETVPEEAVEPERPEQPEQPEPEQPEQPVEPEPELPEQPVEPGEE